MEKAKKIKTGTAIETKSKTSLNFWQACNRRKALRDLKGFKNKILLTLFLSVRSNAFFPIPRGDEMCFAVLQSPDNFLNTVDVFGNSIKKASHLYCP